MVTPVAEQRLSARRSDGALRRWRPRRAVSVRRRRRPWPHKVPTGRRSWGHAGWPEAPRARRAAPRRPVGTLWGHGRGRRRTDIARRGRHRRGAPSDRRVESRCSATGVTIRRPASAGRPLSGVRADGLGARADRPADRADRHGDRDHGHRPEQLPHYWSGQSVGRSAARRRMGRRRRRQLHRPSAGDDSLLRRRPGERGTRLGGCLPVGPTSVAAPRRPTRRRTDCRGHQRLRSLIESVGLDPLARDASSARPLNRLGSADMQLPEPTTAAGRAGLAALLAEPARAVVAVDYDGTLAPIVPRPEDARPAQGAVAALAAVARGVGAVVIVMAQHDQPAQMRYVAQARKLQHGGHRSAGDDDHGPDAATDEMVTPEVPAGVAQARQELPALLAATGATATGATVEDKESSLVVHTRRAADPHGALAALRAPVTELAERTGLE